MAKIYLSSTFEDLQKYREAVYHTLRQMHHDAIAMEDYVAADDRPLDKCLADVAASDLYVGIFAMRYGFIPPKDNPDRKSITELEYRKASAEKKDRLVFLLDEAASWPIKFVDAVTSEESGRAVRSLRESLTLEHSRALFTTIDDLALQVSVAINEVQQRWINQRLEDERKQRAEASQQRAGRARQRVVGQPILDIGDQFRGRPDEQRDLLRLLTDKSTRIVSVLGRAGIGKTALASRVLGELYQAVDGVVYLSTRSTDVTLERLVFECADLLDGDEKDRLLKAWASPQLSIDDKVERLLRALDGGTYVVLLDHLEDRLDAQGQVTDPGLRCFIDHTLAAPRGIRLLVTSRTPLAFDASTLRFDRRVPLIEGLSIEAGVAMLRDLDPNGQIGIAGLSDDQLTRAVTRVHGMPKALESLAVLMGHAEGQRSLDAILDNHEVDEVIREAYLCLDPAERRIVDALAIMGRLVPGVAIEFMVSPWCPGVNVKALIRRLIDVYMVTSHSASNLLSLDAIDQDYALGQLAKEGEYSQQSLNKRAAEFYRALQVPKEQWTTLSDFEPYRLEIEHRYRAEDFEGAAATLARLDPTFVATRGNPEELAAWYERLEGKIADKPLQAQRLLGLGVVRTFLGPLEQAYAHLKAARDLACEIKDQDLEWRAIGHLGEVCRRLGQLDESVGLLRKAYGMGRGSQREADKLVLSLSLALSYSGAFQDAIDCTTIVLERALASRDPELEAHVHDARSLAFLGLAAYDQAHEHARRAIDGYTLVKARDPLGYVLNVEGMASLGLARPDEARQSLESGRRYGQDDSNPRLEGFCLFNLARLCRLGGGRAEALRWAEAATAVLQRVGAAEGAAASALHDALDAEQRGDRAAAAKCLIACGRACLTSTDLYTPLDLLTDAEALARGEHLDAVALEARTAIDRLRSRNQGRHLASDSSEPIDRGTPAPAYGEIHAKTD